MTIHLVQEFLEHYADTNPEKEALVCDGQRLTYGEIEDQANRLANALIAKGVKRGDRIGLYLQNSAEVVVGIFATLKLGAVFVVINPTTKREKMAYILGNCQAKAIIAGAAKVETVTGLVEELETLEVGIVVPGDPRAISTHGLLAYSDLLATFPSNRPPKVNIDLDLACLIYTSGSTGEPKGVMSDHSNVVFAVDSITNYLENVDSDIVINVLPLSFDYGLYQLLMTFSFGGTLVLEKGFAYPAAILKLIDEEQVTGFPGVPTLYSVLLSMDLSAYDLTSLRYLTNTAAALSPSHIQQLRETFSEVRIYSMYGLTETKRTLYLPVDQLDRRMDSVGVAIPGTEVWIEDDLGNRLGPDQVGELVVRGRHVMRGYWGDPEASALRFREGAHSGERLCYTGDLFRMDEEGFFYFVGRQDDIIKSRGEKVSPKEIENVLYKLKGVQEAAVIGISDPVLGQAVKAYVVPKDVDLSEVDVLRHCRAYLEDLMLPKVVEFCTDLPKTASGKIKKTDLK